MAYDVTFTAETLCKGALRTIGEVLNVDDETARMLVDLGVATASGLSPQTGSSAALFADTFLAKTNNLSDVNSPSTSRENLNVASEVQSGIAAYATPKAVAWNSTTPYEFGAIVMHKNATFICIQANTNRVPFAEQAYWQTLSYGWDWMVLPWLNLPFGNSRLLGTGTSDNGTSQTTIQYVRTGLSGTSTANNARAVYRNLATGVPAYPHHYFQEDSLDAGSVNNVSLRTVGKFQSAFIISVFNAIETAGTVFYIDVGRTFSEVSGSGTISPLNAPLDKRGFGIRAVANGLGGLSAAYAAYHDGTTLYEQSFDPSLIKYAGGINKLEITWDGRGNMIWFINGVEVHRTFTPVDIYGFPTWGSIAIGIYNAPNYIGSFTQMLWIMCEETGFITGGG